VRRCRRMPTSRDNELVTGQQQLPIGVVMQRRPPVHRWDESRWQAVAVVPGNIRGAAASSQVDRAAMSPSCIVSGLQLALFPDEHDGYFENWIAPEPKVFVLWHAPADGAAIPIAASVSYSEGARMLDSGDPAAGLPMPLEIHEWLGRYLAENYRPRQRRGREHG
jgi:hypothetical protein